MLVHPSQETREEILWTLNWGAEHNRIDVLKDLDQEILVVTDVTHESVSYRHPLMRYVLMIWYQQNARMRFYERYYAVDNEIASLARDCHVYYKMVFEE